MTTDKKVIVGIVALTILIIVGGVWLSGNKSAKNNEKLSKVMMGEKSQIRVGACC